MLAVSSFLDILLNGSGLGSIVREKNKEAVVFLSWISIIAACASYLGLSDIMQDYAGYMLYLPEGQSAQSILPYWAKCTLEWSFVGWGGPVIAISQFAMLAIMVKSRSISPDDQSL